MFVYDYIIAHMSGAFVISQKYYTSVLSLINLNRTLKNLKVYIIKVNVVF